MLEGAMLAAGHHQQQQQQRPSLRRSEGGCLSHASLSNSGGQYLGENVDTVLKISW